MTGNCQLVVFNNPICYWQWTVLQVTNSHL